MTKEHKLSKLVKVALVLTNTGRDLNKIHTMLCMLPSVATFSKQEWDWLRDTPEDLMAQIQQGIAETIETMMEIVDE